MITRTFTCARCGIVFHLTKYPSFFKVSEAMYKEHCCSKRCAMIYARDTYRPRKAMVLADNNHFFVRVPEHPHCNKNKQVAIATLIMESHIGRYLSDNEIVHHIDGNPHNNDLCNLLLLTDSEHKKLHYRLRRKNTKGQLLPNLEFCPESRMVNHLPKLEG
jgi:hypothetical protein